MTPTMRQLWRRVGLTAVAVVLAAGCGDLSVPATAAGVRVTRLPPGEAAPLAVPMSRARTAAVLPCLKQASLVDLADAGDTSTEPNTPAPLAEGSYLIELTDPRGQRSTLRLVSERALVGPGGRRFASRCLYPLVRDRSLLRRF